MGFKNILEVEDVEINIIERITVTQSDDSNRSNANLMIVKTGSIYQKQKVLKNAKKLGNKGLWEQVHIKKDMTKTEREQHFRLRMELKNRKDQGERNSMLWRGKIVTRKTEQAQGQRGHGDPRRRVDHQES